MVGTLFQWLSGASDIPSWSQLSQLTGTSHSLKHFDISFHFTIPGSGMFQTNKVIRRVDRLCLRAQVFIGGGLLSQGGEALEDKSDKWRTFLDYLCSEAIMVLRSVVQ